MRKSKSNSFSIFVAVVSGLGLLCNLLIYFAIDELSVVIVFDFLCLIDLVVSILFNLFSYKLFKSIKYENQQQSNDNFSTTFSNALKESETRLEKIQAIARVGIWELDLDTQTVWATSEALKIFEKDLTIPLVPFSEIMDKVIPEDRKIIERSLKKLAATKIGIEVIFRILKKNNQLHYIKTAAGFSENSIKGGKKILGLIQDITEERKADFQLKLSKLRLESMIELNEKSNDSIHDITLFVLEKSVEITQSKLGYLAFLNDDETILNLHAWSNSAMEECSIEEKPIMYYVSEMGLWGEAIRQRKAIITNDYNESNVFKKGYPLGHVEIKRHLNVPIFDNDKIIALIGVGNKDDIYDESDIDQLKIFVSEMWSIIRRKKAEQDLIALEERSANMINQLPIGIYRSDVNGNLIFVNNWLVQILGYDSYDELLRISNRDILFKSGAGIQIQKIDDGNLENLSFDIYELKLKTKDNRLISVRNTEKTIRKTDGSVDYYDGTIEDITYRKSIEDELSMLNEQLEKKVFERTKELNEALKMIEDTNEEFRELNNSIAIDSQKLLNLNDKLATKEQELLNLNRELENRVEERTAELNDALSKLEEAGKLNTIVLANLGHELRTPLNGILGFTNILISDVADPDQLDCLVSIKASGDRLKNTLNSLLVLTELEAGKTQLDFEYFNLADYARQYYYSTKDIINQEKLNFVLEIENDILPVYLSEYLLTQIMFNLIDNAIKFTIDGSITIKLKEYSDGVNNFAEISVNDTGLGISDEKISTIFEPFRQVSEGIDRTHEGVGLGLTITKKMIEQMNGQLFVESKVNIGSSFIIRFEEILKPEESDEEFD